MLKVIFSFFIFVHVLCDFYFQTEKTAKKKRTDLRWVLYHAIMYAGIAAALFIIFMPDLEGKYIVLFGIFHGIIDILKYAVCKWFYDEIQEQKRLLIFFIDQTVHILLIAVIVYMLADMNLTILFRAEIISVIHAFDLTEALLLSLSVKLLLLHKPANIAISMILASYRPLQRNDDADDKKMGRLIGTLERIIMMIFMSIGQYSAVGLVLTAKSIARYDRISKQQDFAEYYLLGTLLSTIGAIGISLVF